MKCSAEAQRRLPVGIVHFKIRSRLIFSRRKEEIGARKQDSRLQLGSATDGVVGNLDRLRAQAEFPTAAADHG